MPCQLLAKTRSFRRGVILAGLLASATAASALAAFLAIVKFQAAVSTADLRPVELAADSVVAAVDPADSGIVRRTVNTANPSANLQGGGGEKIAWSVVLEGGYTTAGCDIQVSYVNRGMDLPIYVMPPNYTPLPPEVHMEDDLCGKRLETDGGIVTGTYMVRVGKPAEPGETYGPFDLSPGLEPIPSGDCHWYSARFRTSPTVVI